MSSLVGRGDAPLCPDAVVLCWNDDSLGTQERYPGLRLLLVAIGESGTERSVRARVWARVPRPLDLEFSLAFGHQCGFGLDSQSNQPCA